MSKSSWRLESNRIAVAERMVRAAEKAARTTGRRAEETARATVHVVSGDLQKSIYHEVIPGLLILGAGNDEVDYAPYEEARHPFLWPAWESVSGNFKGEILVEFTKGGGYNRE